MKSFTFCKIRNNTALLQGGGIAGSGTMSLDSCVIENNSAIDGGGMHFTTENLFIFNTSVS